MSNTGFYFDKERITENVPGLYAVMQKWKDKKEEYREEWVKDTSGWGKWPAKYVSTEFVYEGRRYCCYPDDIGLERGNCWDEGFMEFLQAEIEKDLEAAGAVNVVHVGFID